VWEHVFGLGKPILSAESSLAPGGDAKWRNQLGGDCFSEQFIDGRELIGPFSVPEGMLSAEMNTITRPGMESCRLPLGDESFESLHTQRSFEFAKSERPLLQNLGDMAKRCWHLFGLRGYARVDFRVDERNQPWVLEINANPCLSPDAGLAAAAQAG
jgi:D-alanine-D-alanine ligase